MRAKKSAYLTKPFATPVQVDLGGAAKSFYENVVVPPATPTTAVNNLQVPSANVNNSGNASSRHPESDFMANNTPSGLKSTLTSIKQSTKKANVSKKNAKEKLFQDMVAIRDTLPLDFLFEHNLSGFVVERGMKKARTILERFRNRALSAGFEHWVIWTIQEKERIAAEEMAKFALQHGQEKLKQFLRKFLNSKIAKGLAKWVHYTEQIQLEERVAAATYLQMYYRGRKMHRILYRRKRIRNEKRLVILQKLWRQRSAQRRVEGMHKRHREKQAAFLLQRIIRGHLGKVAMVQRRRYLRHKILCHLSAMEIQRKVRGWLGRLRFKHHLILRNAARRIQKIYRGRKAREAVRRYKEEYLDSVMECINMMLQAAEKNNAASSIQELFRHHQISKMVWNIAQTIEDSGAALRLVLEEAEKHVAASKIQNAFQTFSIKRMMERIAENILRRVDRSCRTIQNMTRLHFGRKMIRMWKQRYRLETAMAIKIQSVVRGKFGRVYAKEELRVQTALVKKVTDRFLFRRINRIRRSVLKHWKENRVYVLLPHLRGWRRLNRTVKLRRSAKIDLIKFVKSAEMVTTKSKAFAIKAWIFYVAEEKRMRALMRKAYNYWTSLIKSSVMNTWRAVVQEQVHHRKQLALVFMNIAALETWNVGKRRRDVVKANKYRVKQVWKVMKMFLEWRRERIADAKEFYSESYWKWDASIAIDMLLRYRDHRKLHRRGLALASKHESRRIRKKSIKQWAGYNQRRQFFYSLKKKGDAHFFLVHGKKHIRAWDVEVKRILHLKKCAKRALGHWRHASKSQSWRTWSDKAHNRGIMRRVLIHMTRTRYLDPMFYKWISQAKKVKDALEFRSAQAIQKIWRKIFAQTLRKNMIAKKKYLFDIRVKREHDVLVLTPYNAATEMKKFHMVFVHFYAPFSETPKEKKQFATAASTFVDKAGRKLNFGHMSQVVEEKDQWTGETQFRVNSRIQFAKLDATESDPEDYGRSMGVRYKVMNLPTLRLYWRFGRRGGKLNGQKDPNPTFEWVAEDYKGKFEAGAIMEWAMKKINRLKQIEAPPMINIQRICRGWYARFVKVRGQAAEDYWKREPLWVRKKDRQGKDFYLNRLTGAIQFERPDGYETPRGEPVKKQKLGALLSAMEDGSLDPDDPAWGVPSPLSFKKAALCMVCENDLATWKCLDSCDVPMCDGCMEESHLTGSYQAHRTVSVNIEALHKNAQMCGACEVRKAEMACVECTETYCMECYKIDHARGRRLFHKYVLTSEKRAFKKISGKGNAAHDIISRRGWKTIAQFQAEHAAKEKAAMEKKARLDAMREVVQIAFQRYDKDNSGSIDINEVSEMMREELHEPIEGQELEACMEEMDKDGNGVIDFEEFLDWFTSEKVYGRQASKILKAIRFKMRVEANALKAARKAAAVTDKVLTKGFEKIAVGIDKFSAMKKKVEERLEETKQKAYEDFVPEKIKDRIENPLVPGTAVPPIDFGHYEEKKLVFVRWCREEFLIDIPPADWLEDDKAKDAFEEIFIPAYNAGRLKLRHYHDGRVFKHDDARWKQEWIPDIMEFQYRNLKTKEVERLDPEWYDKCEEAAEKAFKSYDKDNSGALNEKELKDLLSWDLCKPVKGRNLKRLMVEMDINGDGVIDFDEFLPWYAEQTDPNGNNGEWVRAIEQKALEAALKSRKAAKSSAIASAKLAKEAAMAGKYRLYDKFVASPAYLKLVHELRYERIPAEKAVSICNHDFEQSLTWLKGKGFDPLPELTAEEKLEKKKNSMRYKAKKKMRDSFRKSKFASRLIHKVGMARLLQKDKDDTESEEDDEDDY